MATYKEIQEYIKINYNFVPKTCWIAHMKEVYGLPVNIASNRYSLHNRKYPCPIDKQSAIYDAFKYFNMIS